MDADDKLILWSMGLDKTTTFPIAFKKIEWGPEFGEAFHDFQTEIVLAQETLLGHGLATTAKKALAISITEAFERILARARATGSNGLAAHPDLNLARSYARLELIERDAFLLNYLGGLPVKALPLEADAAYMSVLARFESQGLVVRLFEVARSRGCHVTMAVLTGFESRRVPFGLCIGLGCDADFSQAVKHALKEILRNGVWALNLEAPPVTPTQESIVRQSSWRARDHLALALNIEYAQGFISDLELRASHSEVATLPNAGEFTFEDLHWPAEYPVPPLTASVCANPLMQPLVWGPSTPEKINHPRLASVQPKYLVRLRTLAPHPLG